MALLRLTVVAASARLTDCSSVVTWRLTRLTLAAPARVPRPGGEAWASFWLVLVLSRLPRVKPPLVFTRRVVSMAERLSWLALRLMASGLAVLVDFTKELLSIMSFSTATEPLPAIGSPLLSRP